MNSYMLIIWCYADQNYRQNPINNNTMADNDQTTSATSATSSPSQAPPPNIPCVYSTTRSNSNHSIVSILKRAELGLLTGSTRIQRAIIESRTRFGVLEPIRIELDASFQMLTIRFVGGLIPSNSGRSIVGFKAIDLAPSTCRAAFRLDIDSRMEENGETNGVFATCDCCSCNPFPYVLNDFSITSSRYFVFAFLEQPAHLRRETYTGVNVWPPYEVENYSAVESQLRHSILFEDDLVQTCDFASSTNRLALGTEGWTALLPAERLEVAYSYVFKEASTLVTRFSKDEDLLFSGFRNKSILVSDLRIPHNPVCWLDQKNVSSIYAMRRESSYVLASGLTGEIKLWDIRMRKSVLSFGGHVNTQSKLPLIVDEEDSLVISCGEDGTTRVWSRHDAQLLRQIPSPRPVTDSNSIPLVCYSNRWLGIPGNAGVIMAVRDELLLYRFQ